MATHSSILAWSTPRTEQPGGLQSTGSRESDTPEVTRHAHGLRQPRGLPFAADAPLRTGRGAPGGDAAVRSGGRVTSSGVTDHPQRCVLYKHPLPPTVLTHGHGAGGWGGHCTRRPREVAETGAQSWSVGGKIQQGQTRQQPTRQSFGPRSRGSGLSVNPWAFRNVPQLSAPLQAHAHFSCTLSAPFLTDVTSPGDGRGTYREFGVNRCKPGLPWRLRW